MKKVFRTLLLPVMTTFSLSVHAEFYSPLNNTPNPTSNWYISADIGPLWVNTNQSMSVANGSNYPAPENVDDYKINAVKVQPMIAFSAGRRWQRDALFAPAYSVGLRYQYFFQQTIKGNILQYSLPEFNNYSFQWQMNANLLSLYSKVELLKKGLFIPYVDGGIGVSFLEASNYQENAFSGETARISPNFGSQTSSQFAFNVGAGVDIQLSPQALFSIGYDFQSFGPFISNYGQSTWTSTKLNLGTLTANTIIFSITYLI